VGEHAGARVGLGHLCAAGGHLEALQWLERHECPWTGTTCALRAARHGHILYRC